jgi:type IV secretory pathway VirB6-like protein
MQSQYAFTKSPRHLFIALMMEAARTSETSANIYLKFRFVFFWDVLPCKIIVALIMEAARTSETSVDIYLNPHKIQSQYVFTTSPRHLFIALMMEAARTSETSVDIYLKFRFVFFWDVLPCKIIVALMMEAARTSETSVDIYLNPHKIQSQYVFTTSPRHLFIA